MGKATRWFRSLLGLNKPQNVTMTTPNTDARLTPNRRWSFNRSTSKRYHTPTHSIVSVLPQFQLKGDDDQQTAIAAAEVGRVSSRNKNGLKGILDTAGYVRSSCSGNREYWVAVKIQSHFRAYLARKALRALKGLVKLQALVRGHIVRKQIAERLLQMQAAYRARTRARASRVQIYESSQSAIKPSYTHNLGPATPENSEHDIRRSRSSSKHEQSVMLERNGSISTFKVGPDKENLNVRYSNDKGSHDRVYSNSHSFTFSKDSTYHQAFFSPSSGEDQSLSPLKYTLSPLKYTIDVNKASFCTAETSLQVITSKTASSTRSGPFTPTRSEISKSCRSRYSDYFPSYMSDTASSKAKVRSPGAPHQKTQLERSNTTIRSPINGGYGNMKSSSKQNVPSTLHSNFISKAYPGSGRLDRLGIPLGSKGVAFSGGLLSSY